ncbi:MAG: transcriptional regulator/sugar kinase [Proteobacteria bacterium]|nr:transcriptional regulator/sugar kinase [Pseudomonadota bacterium]
MLNRMRLGIDLGGTKIEIVALDDDRTQLLRRRVPAPRGDYLSTVTAVASLIRDAENDLGRSGSIGIGIPGAESLATGLVKNANSTWLIGRPLRRDLQDVLQREVRLANDANCFALSEATDGAAAGADVVFGAILGTGVGGGIVVHGKVLAGANAIAGEWGHNRLPGDEPYWPACYCGRKGCVETFLSGPGLKRDHQQETGVVAEPEQIAVGAAAGDAACEAALDRYEKRLARSLAAVINILDPDVIVLGGGLSNLDRLYASVPELWSAHVFSDRVATKLFKSQHGDASGVRGAAWLW